MLFGYVWNHELKIAYIYYHFWASHQGTPHLSLYLLWFLKSWNHFCQTYIEIINLKTAALFSAATKTGACISGSNEKEKKALESYGRNLGLAFQIADDALDYYAKEKFFGKEIGKDFFEGKVTLPLITIFQKGNEEEKEFLTEIMKKDKRTEDDFSETLALIFKYKAVETSLKKAEYFVNVSYDALAIFPESEDKKILQRLTSFSLNRSF